MTTESAAFGDSAIAEVSRNLTADERVRLSGYYTAKCYDKDGNLKWEAKAPNLVTTAGKNDILTNQFKGSAYTAAWYIGLVDNSGFSAYAAADTMSSHAGWTESTVYSNATRVAPSFGTASAGSLASTATAFTINGAATLDGCFLTTVSTKGGTTGTLYSAGAFTGGDRTVANLDTLNITYTATAT